MPYGIAVAGGRLLATDTANLRLVAWSSDMTGALADRLTGQPEFACKGDNGWGTARRDSLCWP